MMHMGGWRVHARFWLVVGALGVAVLLSGCSQQLFGALDEGSANQVVGALRSEGISATKSAATDGMWSVHVPDADFAQAVQVLQRRNLPPRQFDGFGTVFRKESLVSTPTEERARLTHAVAQELERSLMEIDGVLLARVHPVIPPNDLLSEKRAPATASVLIKHRPGVDMSGRETQIRALVASGIEGLLYSEVRVVMVPAEPLPAQDESIMPAVRRTLPPTFWVILGGLVGVMLLSHVLLNWRDRIWITADEWQSRFRKRRMQPRGAAPDRS